MRRKLGEGALLALLIIGGAVQARGQESELTPSVAFWKTLGDTTLVRLVGEVVKSNHDVVAARARLRGARAARLQAALDFAPTVTATASYTRQRFASASFPGSFGSAFPDQSVWDAGLQFSWELDVFGRIRKTRHGRGALIAAAEEHVKDLQVLLASDLTIAYFDLRGAQHRLRVSRGGGGRRGSVRLARSCVGRRRAGGGRAQHGAGRRHGVRGALVRVLGTLTHAPLRHRAGNLLAPGQPRPRESGRRRGPRAGSGG